MLRQRVFSAIVLLPVGLWVIFAGGIFYLLVIALIVALASVEYVRLFKIGGYRPSVVLVVGGSVLFVLARYASRALGDPLASDTWVVTVVVLLSMTFHLIAFERGRENAGVDMAITIGGVLYVGLLGSYLIPLRFLPEGEWWVLVTLPAVWLADSGAYFIGRRFGRHRLSPRLSPKKTWEGFLGGIVVGTVGVALLAMGWRSLAGSELLITPMRSAVLGFILAVITPLGDLGASMLKRQVGVKDTGTLIPGHGGVLDRIDSWIWAAALGFYIISVFFVG